MRVVKSVRKYNRRFYKAVQRMYVNNYNAYEVDLQFFCLVISMNNKSPPTLKIDLDRPIMVCMIFNVTTG